jgi:hypothetical protein
MASIMSSGTVLTLTCIVFISTSKDRPVHAPWSNQPPPCRSLANRCKFNSQCYTLCILRTLRFMVRSMVMEQPYPAARRRKPCESLSR